MTETLEVAPVGQARQVRRADGALLTVPDGWELVPPGDAGLTRRVKAAGPSWTVIEKRGRKRFSRGIWAPAEHIRAARTALEAERADPALARRLASAARRREAAQADYVKEFRGAVLSFLAFGAAYDELARRLADAVTAHATPVGSGTVARTQRLTVEGRAAAAVVAWLRHQTTSYDHMVIARIKGRRREVRRELAAASRRLLEAHRGRAAHPAGCPLCAALAG
jgi:hypothetical protein